MKQSTDPAAESAAARTDCAAELPVMQQCHVQPLYPDAVFWLPLGAHTDFLLKGVTPVVSPVLPLIP